MNFSLVYPPCPVQHLLSSSSLDLIRSPHIISVGQFRPEKDHELQLRAFAAFISSDYIRSRKSQADLMKSNRQWKSVDSGSSSFSLFQSNHTPSAFQFDGRTKLFLIGGCRDAVDQARVAHLKSVAHTLGIEDSVEFLVNVDNTTLSLYLSTSLVCLHSMWNEHFGISCVESMASGTILIAHNSGGPRQDIVLPENGMTSLSAFHFFFRVTTLEIMSIDKAGIETGYLASTPEEYAQHMQTIFESYYPPLTNASTSSWSAKHQHLQAVRAAARRRSQMFSDENFANSFLQTVRQVKI
jgi:glycosyltransferase involved in cell wall biosynthesis